jgi:hypothetical protein
MRAVVLCKVSSLKVRAVLGFVLYGFNIPPVIEKVMLVLMGHSGD